MTSFDTLFDAQCTQAVSPAIVMQATKSQATQQKPKQWKAQTTTKAGGQGPEEHYPCIGKACISSKPLKFRKQRLVMNDSNANNGYLPNVPGGNIGILHFQDSKFCVGDGQ